MNPLTKIINFFFSECGLIILTVATFILLGCTSFYIGNSYGYETARNELRDHLDGLEFAMVCEFQHSDLGITCLEVPGL